MTPITGNTGSGATESYNVCKDAAMFVEKVLKGEVTTPTLIECKSSSNRIGSTAKKYMDYEILFLSNTKRHVGLGVCKHVIN